MSSQEVMGSRREWETGKDIWGERLWVGDAPSDAPNTADYFVPKGTTTAESGLTGRKCVHVNMDPEVIPGIMFFRSVYRALKAFA